MSNVTQLWDACAQSIRDQVSDGVWQSTFKEARPQSITENELILTVPNQWVKAQVEGKYNPLVLEALEEASKGSPVFPATEYGKLDSDGARTTYQNYLKDNYRATSQIGFDSQKFLTNNKLYQQFAILRQ